MDFQSLPLEQGCDRVAYGSTAPMAYVERAGGVRGDEFDHRATGHRGGRAAIAVGLIENARDHRLARRRRQEQVNETGTGDFDAFEPWRGLDRCRDRGGELARIALQRLAELQCGVARVVAVLRLVGTLERQLQNRLPRRNARYRRVKAGGEFGAGIGQGGAVVAGDGKVCNYSSSAWILIVVRSCKLKRIDIECPANAPLPRRL